jgi:hypothetical protein
MERKKLTEASSKRVIENEDIIVINPEDVVKTPLKFQGDKNQMEILKAEGKIRILNKQNIGKGLDVLKNIVSIASQLIEIKKIKIESEAELAKIDKLMEKIEKEADEFIRIERDKRETIFLESEELNKIIDKIIDIAQDKNISEDVKTVTIKAISKASFKK